MNEKPLPNRYKEPEEDTSSPETAGKPAMVTRLLKPVLLLCVLSVSAVLAHDVVVQSPFFTIRQVDIQGEHRVKKEEILDLAQLSDPANIFRVNLAIMEKRICSHPWISV